VPSRLRRTVRGNLFNHKVAARARACTWDAGKPRHEEFAVQTMTLAVGKGTTNLATDAVTGERVVSVTRREIFALVSIGAAAAANTAQACTPGPPPPPGMSADALRELQRIDTEFPKTPDAKTLVEAVFRALAARDRAQFAALFSPTAYLTNNGRSDIPLMTWFDRTLAPRALIGTPNPPLLEDVFFWGSLSAKVIEDGGSMCGPGTDYRIYRFTFVNVNWLHGMGHQFYKVSRLEIL